VKCRLGRFKAYPIAQGAQAEAGFVFKLSRQVIRVIAGAPRHVGERARGAEQVADLRENAFRRTGCGGRRVVQQAGHDGENRGVIGKVQAPLGGNAGEHAVKFVEGVWREPPVARAEPGGALELIIEHQAKWTAAPAQREAMRHAGGNDKEIAGARGARALAHALRAFPGEIQNELGPVVLVGLHLGFPMSVQLEFPQDKAQRVDLDFLN